MKILFFLVFIILKNFINSSGQNEISVALDIMNELYVRHCIIVSHENNHKEPYFKNIKQLSSENVLATYLNYKQLTNYIHETNYFSKTIGIIIKDTRYNQLKIIWDQLALVGELRY